MRSLVFLVPGSLDTPTGGYVYDRRMIEGLARQGWSVDVRELDGSFPDPTESALLDAGRILANVPAGAIVMLDGLAFSAMPDLIERESRRLRLAALVHLPLAADVTLDADERRRFATMERRALRAASLVVVTGQGTPDLMSGYGLDRERIVIVEPGTTRAQVTRRNPNRTVALLSVGTLHPGKGHATLLEALAPLRHLDWHLTCAGSLTRHPDTTARVLDTMTRLGLGDRVTLAGELDDSQMHHCYDDADVFVLATLQETYGMAVAEALAHGLPVVATTTGAIPRLVGDDAGLLVEPGNVRALTAALECVIGDGPLRARLAEGAARAGSGLRSWDEASGHMSSALSRLITHG